MRQVYFNPMQRAVLRASANTAVVVAGRGTGKSLLHAAYCLRCFQQMPRSTTAFVAPSALRAKTNTLPSMLQHWETWGYRRGVHWDIGHRPPKALGWPLPLVTPEHWENVITFYNGACGQIISQDRVGTSNSKSFDFIDIDEAKFIDYERLKDETLPANRGNVREFGACPWHHGMLITSDMPVTTKGSWFMSFERKQTPDLLQAIDELQAEEAALLARSTAGADALSELNAYRRSLSELRRYALYYGKFSSLTNIEILGEAWIRQMKRDLPPMVFRTSILCERVGILKDGFYSSMRERHKYTATDMHELDALGYDFSAIGRAASSCRFDADLRADLPLAIAFDYNANINWLVAGQTIEEEARLNVVRSFFVKYERKLPELIDDFCSYYAAYALKEVVFYYDSTALGSNYAVSNQDFRWVICNELRKKQWRVRPVYIGAPMKHIEKHLLINRAFDGRARLTPYFNQRNNEALLQSIETAGIYNGKKDKRGEKLAETTEDRLEARTDGSDAFDTLFIGCERFPQKAAMLRVTSGSA